MKEYSYWLDTVTSTRSDVRSASVPARGMAKVFPELGGARIDYAWGGNVAFTRDQMPRAGLLDAVYYAGGYPGHGVAMATYLGRQIARRIAGELIDNPLFDDRFRRFRGTRATRGSCRSSARLTR